MVFLLKFQNFIMWIRNNRKKFIFSSLIVLILAIGLTVFIFNRDLLIKIIRTGPRYAQGFVLVDDKISQGADIVINVPPFSVKKDMMTGLKFDPEIKGTWISNEDEKKIIYKPIEKLELGNYYKVISETSQGVLGKDFQIVAPPQVEAVFPKSGSETNEKSNITIIFSRPMVALTTLDELAKKDIPLEIKPETKGKFKWIGTKTLQFIPEETLIPSSNYTVNIKSGFRSVEGLELPGLEQKFITRPLRYENVPNNAMVRPKRRVVRRGHRLVRPWPKGP